MPLKLTPVAPVKVVPVSVTTVPTLPLVGNRLVRTGTGTGTVTVKTPALKPVPPGVVIET